jgi:hypothetical protein
MRTTWLVCLALLAAAATVRADNQFEVVPALEPQETEVIRCEFEGRTLTGIVGATSVKKTNSGGAADATPAAQLIAEAFSGSSYSFTINPDFGCGSPGCRNGNTYLVKAQLQATDTSKPTCNVFYSVRKVVQP